MPGSDRPSSFDRPVRILMVEDSRSDAELIIRHLERNAPRRPEFLQVQEEAPFREALASFDPDVVLVDNHLPRFSGRRALRIARRHDRFLPVIMVTGTLREERIIRLTALGLTNYVLKDRMLRLAPAVVHALGHAEEQRRAARDRAALEASERRFRAVAHASGDALLIADGAGHIVFWNPAAERLFGYPADEVIGTEAIRLVPRNLREESDRYWRQALEGVDHPAPFTHEVPAQRADGAVIPVELTISRWEEEGRPFYSAQIRDISARKEEARIRHILSEAVEQTVTSVVITRLDHTIEYVNRAFEQLTGYTSEDVRGKTPRLLQSGRHGPDFYGTVRAELRAGRTFTGEFVNRRKDGTEYHQRTIIFPILSESGEPERYVGLGQDVTQERVLESQLRQAQKMEAVGQLAGGIAHDFNNILTGVLTNAQLLEMILDADTEEREYVEDIVTAARRGSELVRRLMTLARTENTPPRRVDVREVVDEALRTVRRILPENIEVSVEHPSEALPSVVDEGGLHQALLNVANNARDAMPGGGRLFVRTRNVNAAPRGGSPVPCAVIDVRDTGVGMPAKVRERVFEPFFTTKETGKGTGLGLSMVYGFATRAGGDVRIESTQGVGTTLTLVLPLSYAEEGGTGQREPAAADPVAAPVSGTVLLAEDQDDIRRVAEKVLSRMGFQVLSASDGAEALAILARERGRIDLVVSDLVMPRGGGAMLYRNTVSWPDRPRFLFMSGYAADELNGDSDLLDTVPFLPKPFTLDSLEAAVRRTLETT